VDALKRGQPTPLGAAVGIHALKVLLSVYRSAKTDSWAAIE
jgi:hypothetical protein